MDQFKNQSAYKDFTFSIEEKYADELIKMTARLFFPLILMIMIAFTFVITLFSCCFYDYCPLVFRKPSYSKYSLTEKLLPVFVLFFSGFLLVLPTIIGYQEQ